MITVCREHVNKGVQMFQAPHVTKTSINAKCLFCQNRASFEVDYFGFTPTKYLYTISNNRLNASV